MADSDTIEMICVPKAEYEALLFNLKTAREDATRAWDLLGSTEEYNPLDDEPDDLDD